MYNLRTDVDIYLHSTKGDTPKQNNTMYLIIKTYKTKVPTRRISIPQDKAISISNVNHIGVSVGEDSTDKIWGRELVDAINHT